MTTRAAVQHDSEPRLGCCSGNAHLKGRGGVSANTQNWPPVVLRLSLDLGLETLGNDRKVVLPLHGDGIELVYQGSNLEGERKGLSLYE